MKGLILCWITLLAGCISHPPLPPCELPPRTVQLGHQQWTAAGERVYLSAQECLSRAGTWHQSNHEQRRQALEHSATQGDTQAWLKLGQYHLSARPPRYSKARAAFIAAFELGDQQGAWHLGHMAQHGMGQVADPLSAINWFQRAVEGQTLVPLSQLQASERQTNALHHQMQQAQTELAITRRELGHLKTQWTEQTASLATPLYRFDLNHQERCGIGLNWQTLGREVAGLAMALRQFEAQYAGSGWLWLTGGYDTAWLDTPLAKQVLDDFLATRSTPVILSGRWSEIADLSYDRVPLVFNQSPEQIVHWRNTRIRFDCSL